MRRCRCGSGGLQNPSAFLSYMSNVNSGGEMSIAGSTGRSREQLIDGTSNVIPESGGTVFNPPSAEAFGEVQLIVGNYSAEYGRVGGGIEIFTTQVWNQRPPRNLVLQHAPRHLGSGRLEHQSEPRQRPGLPAQGSPERDQRRNRRPGLYSQGLRRPQQDVLLFHHRQRSASAIADLDCQHGAHQPDDEGRLQPASAVDLRSGDHRRFGIHGDADSVREQSDSHQPVQQDFV